MSGPYSPALQGPTTTTQDVGTEPDPLDLDFKAPSTLPYQASSQGLRAHHSSPKCQGLSSRFYSTLLRGSHPAAVGNALPPQPPSSHPHPSPHPPLPGKGSPAGSRVGPEAVSW